MKKPVKKIAKVAAIGAGIGYLAGLLTAKQSGKETREDILTLLRKLKTLLRLRLTSYTKNSLD